MAHAPIQLQVHPPERRQRHGGVQLNSGCCCCCCCLHTAGGLVGALIGSVTGPTSTPPHWIPPPPPDDVLAEFRPRPVDQLAPPLPPLAPAPRDEHVAEKPGAPLPERPADTLAEPTWAIEQAPPRRAMSGTGVYWLTLLVLTPLACVLVGAYNGRPSQPFDWAAGFLGTIFFGLPFVQLAASAVAAVIVLIRSPAAVERAHLWQIGRITLWTILGTLVGTGALALMCGLLG